MPDVIARGVRFNVLRMGQGEAVVVFVHGLPLDNLSSYFMTLAPDVSKHARVLLYDLRGHGKSEQPPSGYTGEDMAADLAGILDALGEARVIVVGHSFGGYVALRYAADYPDRVRGLVLLDAQSGVAEIGARIHSSVAMEGEERDRKFKEVFGNWLAKHAARGRVDVDAIDLDDLDADGRSTAQFAARLSQRRRRSPMIQTAVRLRDETSFVRDLMGTTPIDDATLARIACPTVGIFGEISDLRVDAARLQRVMPDFRLVLVPGVAHGILFHATPFVRDHVVAAIRELTAQPGSAVAGDGPARGAEA